MGVSIFPDISTAVSMNIYFLVRIGLAFLCGTVIGMERGRRFKEAGIRTHVIVCCTAALIMIISKYAFADLTGPSGEFIMGVRGSDPARIAAQVISGITFLGAGIIFKNGGNIKGLTTAAGIWATAAIGLALGAGMIFIGIFMAAMVSIFQILSHKYPTGQDSYTTTYVRLAVDKEEGFKQILHDQLQVWNAQMTGLSITRTKDGQIAYDMTLLSMKPISVEELEEFADKHDEIRFISGSGDAKG